MTRYQSLIFNDKTVNLHRNIFLVMLVNNTHIRIFMISFGIKLKQFITSK